MGGGIAISFAITHPQMVDALVPVASGLPGSLDTDARRRRRARMDDVIRREDRDGAVNLIVELWADGVSGKAPPQVRRRVGEIFTENVETFFRTDVPERDPPWKAIDRLEEIRAPTLVIVGDRDQPDILAIADTLEERIPRARKVVIQDTAHMVNMERPAQFNRLVLDFLEETIGKKQFATRP